MLCKGGDKKLAKPNDKTLNVKVSSDEHILVKKYCMRKGLKISDILRPIVDDIVNIERNLSKIKK